MACTEQHAAAPSKHMAPKDKRRKRNADAATSKAAAATAATAANREHSWLLKLEDDVIENILEHHLGSLLTARASCKDLHSRADAVAAVAAADKQHWLAGLSLPRNKFVVLAALDSRAVELTAGLCSQALAAQSIDSEVEFVKRHGVLSALHTPDATAGGQLTRWDLAHAELLTALFLLRVGDDGFEFHRTSLNHAPALQTARARLYDGMWHKLVKKSRLQVVHSIAMSKTADDQWNHAYGCIRLSSLLASKPTYNRCRGTDLPCDDNGVPRTPPSPAVAAMRLTAMATKMPHRLIEAMRRNTGDDAFDAAVERDDKDPSTPEEHVQEKAPEVLQALCNGGLYSSVLNVREAPPRCPGEKLRDFEQRAALVRQHQDVARACREQARDAGGLPILLTELAANEDTRGYWRCFPDRIHQLRMVTTALLIEARGPQDLNGLRPKQLRAAFELLRLGSEPASVDKDELLRELMRLVEHHRQTAGVLPKSLYGHAGVPGA